MKRAFAGFAAAAAFFVVLRAGAAFAQELELARGTPEFSAFAGGGTTVKVNRGVTRAWVIAIEPQAAFRLGSRLQWLIEGHAAQYFEPSGWAAGLLPAGARYYFDRSRHAFYLDFLAGFCWTNLDVVEIDRRFNFVLTGGPGLRGTIDAHRSWCVEARWLHYSNAGTVLPNLGLNGVILLGGWKFR